MSHVAITGASSGIGEALAREFAQAGHTLTLVARRKGLLDKLAASCGVKCRVVQHDLSDPARAAQWIAPAEAELGPIEVLVNNAGIENTGRTPGSDLSLGMKVLATNLETPLAIIHAVLPAMLSRGKGTIVNVSSVAAFTAMPLMSWYGASKAGLALFSESLRSELRSTPVRVVTVYPGPVKTAMGDAAYQTYGGRKGLAGMMPEGRTGPLARRVRRAVERGASRVVYPRFYYLTRWASSFAIFTTAFTPLPDPKR